MEGRENHSPSPHIDEGRRAPVHRRSSPPRGPRPPRRTPPPMYPSPPISPGVSPPDLIQPFAVAALVASFTSRPCSHARTHIHIYIDEALPSLPPPRNSVPGLVVLGAPSTDTHPGIERDTADSRRAARYLHHNSDFFLLPLSLSPPLPHLYLSAPRADRCRWRLFGRGAPLSLSHARSLGPTPPSARGRVCVCRARGAHRLSAAAVTPGKHETRRETDGRHSRRGGRVFPRPLRGYIRDLKFARVSAARTYANKRARVSRPGEHTYAARITLFISFSRSISVRAALSTPRARSLDLRSPGPRYPSFSFSLPSPLRSTSLGRSS